MKSITAAVATATILQSISAFAPPASSTTVARRTSPSELCVSKTEDIAADVTTGAKEGQAEVVLVGCGAPNRGMGWYHAIQMLEGR